MTQPSPAVRELSRRVIERERNASGDDVACALRAAFDGLERVMSGLVGPDGYSALTLRARHLTADHASSFDVVASELAARFSADDWPALVAGLGPITAEARALALFGNVLHLFCVFIGEDLTFRLITRAWNLQGESARPDRDEGGPVSE